MRHGSRTVLLLGVAGGSIGAAAPGADVIVRVEGLRSERGQILACLTANLHNFPDCRSDPAAHKLVVPARHAAVIDFGTIASGRYAIALLHDENGNGRADMAVMIPREGFGFSRNAPARFGPPSFDRAAFAIGDTPVSQTIRMRYIF